MHMLQSFIRFSLGYIVLCFGRGTRGHPYLYGQGQGQGLVLGSARGPDSPFRQACQVVIHETNLVLGAVFTLVSVRIEKLFDDQRADCVSFLSGANSRAKPVRTERPAFTWSGNAMTWSSSTENHLRGQRRDAYA